MIEILVLLNTFVKIPSIALNSKLPLRGTNVNHSGHKMAKQLDLMLSDFIAKAMKAP